jgi:hypothetical protein
VETVWLEFDSPSLGDAVPVPSVFFSAPALDRARAGRVALGGVETLRGAPLSAGARRNLRRCMDALPAEAALTYLGVMLARPGDSVRFCATLPAAEVARYLAAVGWAHPTAPVERILGDVVRGFAPRVVLNLDVGETLLPTLGVEVKPEPEGLWPAFMERLVARGLCSPAQAGAVLGWPGHDAALEGMRAGVDVSLAPPPGAPAAATALRIRTLNHAKLVVRPGCRPQAKVYLYAGFVWPRAAEGA